MIFAAPIPTGSSAKPTKRTGWPLESLPAAAEVARKLYDELEKSDVLAVLKEKRAAKKAA